MSNLSKYKRSAIIGYYRSGASLEWICVATGLEYHKVEAVINAYFGTKNR
mgnify:CR=1